MKRANKPIAETVYQYDYKSRAWVSAAKRYGAISAKDVPIVILGEFNFGEWDYQCFHANKCQRVMWCAEHKRFEKIHHIERIDSIRSIFGCRKHGVTAFFSFNAPPIENKLTAPFRWRVALHNDGKAKVSVDALRFCPIHRGKNEYKDHCTENYIVYPHRITLSEIFDIQKGDSEFCRKNKDWADYGVDIPAEVTAKVIEHLEEYAPKGYNAFSESVTDGARKLRAFVKRPMDFHIEYWRGFFSDAEFEKLFPEGQSDNLPILCHELNLAVTENLRAAYEKNPYAPLWEKLLRFLGFKDDKAISYFYELKDFAGMRAEHFRFDKSKDELILDGLKGWRKIDDLGYEFLMDTETVTAYEAHNRFAMLRFYVAWALSESKERAFAKRGLYALATKAWSNDLREELDFLYWRFRAYCHHACAGEGDNPWVEIAADVERLSVLSKHHLLGFNTEWFGWHWQIEHNRLMEEFNALGSPRENALERKPKKKLCRLARILKIYDSILANNSPLIPIRESEYPPSMFKRDMKVINAFDPSIVKTENGQIEHKPRYALQGEFPPLPNDERRARLLAYRLFLEDCGYITIELAEKIVGKKISRRTFVRDLEFLRENCACGILTYNATKKIYAWESLGDD